MTIGLLGMMVQAGIRRNNKTLKIWHKEPALVVCPAKSQLDEISLNDHTILFNSLKFTNESEVRSLLDVIVDLWHMFLFVD